MHHYESPRYEEWVEAVRRSGVMCIGCGVIWRDMEAWGKHTCSTPSVLSCEDVDEGVNA